MARRSTAPHLPAVEIIVLAGGLSTRMGRNKAQLRLGGLSLLARVRAAARATGWPVRTVHRDIGPRRGPLGGVATAFHRSRAKRLVFLPCDLPFISAGWIRRVGQGRARAVFTQTTVGAGFPFALGRECAPVVNQQLVTGKFSLQQLARQLKAKRLRLPARRAVELLNLNTPEDWHRARACTALPSTA